LIRWISSLLVLVVYAFFLDRVLVTSMSSPLALPAISPRGVEGAAPAVRRTSEATASSSFDRNFHLPIERASILGVEYAPVEPGTNDGGRALHIAAPRATPVTAGFDGEVLAVTHLTSSGLSIDLMDEAHHRIVRYGHLLRLAPSAKNGATIERGELIGWVGDTGDPAAGRFALHLSLHRVPPDGRWWEAESDDLGGVIAGFRPKDSKPDGGTRPPG